MAHVKTAISLEQSLFERVEEVAEQLHVSRSQLIARALKEFFRQHHNRQLFEQINQAYSGEPDPAERAYLTHMKQKHRKQVEAEGRW